MNIIWSKIAVTTYKEILDSLHVRWTKKEKLHFINTTNSAIDSIKRKQVVHPLINKKIGVRKATIHKNVSLFYTMDLKNNTVYILTFFNNRMNPNLLNKMLTKE